ncbi:MAG TPA: DUF459 domain-containing protein [Candidatus Saccharimonadales bacterium]|jgi:hypothetical protein|nr:DUF459 domain-containing protein [Candidatus Saccharimonadales bacterium]
MDTTVPARRVAVVAMLALALWAATMAPKLERSAASAPIGLWRDAQLALLAPLQRGSPAARVAPSGVAPLRPPELREIPTTPAPGAATASPPSGLRQPTVADPLRVLIVGDSLGKDFAYGFAALADETTAVTTDARPATGLSRPDYFDWPAQLRRDIAASRPELIIVMLGGDDAQPFEVDGRPVAQGTDEWREVYSARVTAFMDEACSDGRTVLWLGLPVMSDDSFSARMRELNTLFAAAAHGCVHFAETWPLFSDAAGRYAAFLPDAAGRMQPVRQLDGIHFSVAGALRVGAYAHRLVADELSTSPSPPRSP